MRPVSSLYSHASSTDHDKFLRGLKKERASLVLAGMGHTDEEEKNSDLLWAVFLHSSFLQIVSC